VGREQRQLAYLFILFYVLADVEPCVDGFGPSAADGRHAEGNRLDQAVGGLQVHVRSDRWDSLVEAASGLKQ